MRNRLIWQRWCFYRPLWKQAKIRACGDQAVCVRPNQAFVWYFDKKQWKRWGSMFILRGDLTESKKMPGRATVSCVHIHIIYLQLGSATIIHKGQICKGRRRQMGTSAHAVDRYNAPLALAILSRHKPSPKTAKWWTARNELRFKAEKKLWENNNKFKRASKRPLVFSLLCMKKVYKTLNLSPSRRNRVFECDLLWRGFDSVQATVF